MNMNLPNFISALRIVLVPIIIILLLDKSFNKALVVFVIAGLSDGVDGFLARWLKQKTRLGAYLDPIADKLLLSSTYITLATLRFIPNWLAVAVVSRDVVIVLGVATLFITGSKLNIRPSIISKVTTLAQICTMIVILSRDCLTSLWQFAHFFVWLTTVLTVISGLHYIYLGIRVVSHADQEQ